MASFTHLHVHSQYTLLGGTASVEGLVAQAAAEGMSHLTLTDTNALYGAVAFDQACRAAGIRPILGMTATVAWPPDLTPPGAVTALGILVLLAANRAGYRSLCRLSSLIQGRPDREIAIARGLGLDDLGAHTNGLICLSGGRRGWLERCLRAGAADAARQYVARLTDIYGDRLYLSLELHDSQDVALARQIEALGLPTVAVQPVYGLSPEDRSRLRLLAAIDHNCPLEAVPPAALPDGGDLGVGLHWLSPAEIRQRFAEFPEALERVGQVTGLCQPALPAGRTLWPALDLPDSQTPEGALVAQAQAGLIERYGPEPGQAVTARLERELAIINGYGYAPLFLIVADVVRHAHAQEIPVSTRGSVANSLVAYCLAITSVDPIEHNLLFERFLSPGRPDLPDIDLDFCSRRRDEVLDYVRRHYGQERVAQVATVSSLQWRSAIRETAKAYGLDEGRLKPLLAGLPRGWRPASHRRRLDLQDVLDRLDDPELRRVIRAAAGIVGQPHHLSVHPGGMVITPGPLTDTLPLQWAPKGFLITQFDHSDVEALGLPKLDLLGIRALTVLADAAECVRRDHNPAFRLADVPLDDPATAQALSAGDTIGVFQCESEGARRTLRQLQAGTLRDLAVANAFFKPGPATGGMAQIFIRRYRGEAEVDYLHPALEPILASTKGVLLFQEQILRLAVEIAGLSWEQAGFLRRGMSKMDPAEMDRIEAEFVAGCQRPAPDGPGLSPEQARELWQQVQVFSGYGFNKGHATAYADVSYRSAYLKTHWPAAFFCARLRNWGGYHHPAVYMAEAIHLGIEVRPPHVNHSRRRVRLAWERTQPVLWLGLGLVRDLRRRSVVELVGQQQRRPFAGLRDLLSRVPLQDNEIAHLIQAGALDGLGESRATLLAEADLAQRAGNPRQLAFGFGRSKVQPESLGQRLAWEKHLLGYPFQSLRKLLPQITARQPETVSLRQLSQSADRRGSVIGVKLPGWGRGHFNLWDGETWASARSDSKPPRSWEPVQVRGHWVRDRWGVEWMQVEAAEKAVLGMNILFEDEADR